MQATLLISSSRAEYFKYNWTYEYEINYLLLIFIKRLGIKVLVSNKKALYIISGYITLSTNLFYILYFSYNRPSDYNEPIYKATNLD